MLEGVLRCFNEIGNLEDDSEAVMEEAKSLSIHASPSVFHSLTTRGPEDQLHLISQLI